MIQKVLVAGLCALGFFLLIKGPAAPRRQAWENQRTEVETNLSEARTLQTRAAWQEAIPVVERALEKDPLNQEARQLKILLKQEVLAQREFEEGIAAFDTGDYDRALNSFGGIPAGTRHYTEAQEKRATAQDRLLSQYRDRAERACREGRWKTCQSEACTHLAYEHAEALVRLLSRAESRLARQRGFERCEALQAHNTDDPKAVKRKELLATIYPDARLQTAMASYAVGKLPEAVRELSKVFVDSRRRSLQGQASSLRHDVQRVEGYVKRIREAERSGDIMMALRQFGLIRKVDKELLKGKLESRVLNSSRALLSTFLLKRATQRREQKRFKEALADLSIIYRIDADNVALSGMVKKLISEAPADVAQAAQGLLKSVPSAAKTQSGQP